MGYKHKAKYEKETHRKWHDSLSHPNDVPSMPYITWLEAEIDRLADKNKKSVEQWFGELLESYKDDFGFQNEGLIFELTEQVSLLTARAEKAETDNKLLAGHLANCINHLHHINRRYPREDMTQVIEQANMALVRTKP